MLINVVLKPLSFQTEIFFTSSLSQTLLTKHNLGYTFISSNHLLSLHGIYIFIKEQLKQ